MNILYFVFSWKGQYENACKLESTLQTYGKVIVINSDDDNTPDHWINIGNECYFSDQFRKALEVSSTIQDWDAICHVQADASYDDFESIINSAKSSFEKYNWGVYAPNVDDTFYISDRTDIRELEDGLTLVATPDNTCWFIHKDMIEELNKNLFLMDRNVLGWGWDLLICAFSHLAKRKVIRDYNYTVDHPPSTGYKKNQAESEMQYMFERCPNNIKEVIYYIKTQPRSLYMYHRDDGNDVLVYDTTVGAIL